MASIVMRVVLFSVVLIATCRTVVARASSPARALLLKRGMHLDIAKAKSVLGAEKLRKLTKDVRCQRGVTGLSQQPDQPCLSLCLGTPDCVGACMEVRTMLCIAPSEPADPLGNGGSAAIAAAATAAASNAVHDALKDAITDAAAEARASTVEAEEDIAKSMSEARRVAQRVAHNAGTEAASAARTLASDQAAHDAHAIATTAAAAAGAAVHEQIRADNEALAAAPAAGAPGAAAAR